jgi:hypothetical protein
MARAWPFSRKSKRPEEGNQRFGLALHDLPLRVHNAHAQEFQ